MKYLNSYTDYLIERSVDAIPSNIKSTEYDVNIKEGSIVVLYNMLNSVRLKKSKINDYSYILEHLISYMKANPTILNHTLTSDTLQSLRHVYYNKKNLPSSAYLSYWLSSALILHEMFNGYTMYRNSEFFNLKYIGSKLSGVSQESWSRMDVILVKFGSDDKIHTITTEMKKVMPNIQNLKKLEIKDLKRIGKHQERLNQLNDLFLSPNDFENQIDKNLIAISLKEGRSQHGRVNDFLKHLSVVDSDQTIISFDNSIKHVTTNNNDLIHNIIAIRNKIESNHGNIQINSQPYDFLTTKELQIKFVAYKILEMLCTYNTTIITKNQPNISNTFVGMVAWALNLLFSPPYFKVVGDGKFLNGLSTKNNARVVKFWSGMSLSIPKNKSILVYDHGTTSELKIDYGIILNDDYIDTKMKGNVEIAIRTSGYDNVDVIFRKIKLDTSI